MNKEQAAALRKAFPDEAIGQINRGGGVVLDYVGHAATTDRLLSVDPEWTWEPLAIGSDGLPSWDGFGGLWIRLTVCGVTRLGYGDAGGKKGPNAVKEAIGDAIRNAAMRYGVALDLWAKEDLSSISEVRSKDDGTDASKSKSRQNVEGSTAAAVGAKPRDGEAAPTAALDRGPSPTSEGVEDSTGDQGQGEGPEVSEGTSTSTDHFLDPQECADLIAAFDGKKATALLRARSVFGKDINSIADLTFTQAAQLIAERQTA